MLLKNVNPYLSLTNQDIPIPEVYKHISIVRFKPIFGSDHLEKFSTFSFACLLQFLEQTYNLLRSFSFYLAPEKIINVESKLFSSLMGIQIIFCQLDEHAEAVDNRLVGGRSDCTLEEEAIYNVSL